MTDTIIKGDGDVKAALDFATQRSTVDRVDITESDAGVFVAIPAGRNVQDITAMVNAHLPAPRRTKGTATLITEAAFLAHVKRFASADDSAVFLQPKGNATATAVYDYHAPGEPAWCEHRAQFTPSQSREWQWLAASARAMSQPDFAAWMEDAMAYAVNPSETEVAAKKLTDLGYVASTRTQLLAFGRDVNLRVDVEAQSMTRLDTGAVKVVYAETVKGAGDSMSVPSGFVLRVPVLDGDAAHADVPVRLRVKVVGKAVQLTVVPLGMEDVLRLAVEACFSRIRAGVACAVFDGSPER